MSASDTTCWGCPGCGAVLTTRTAVAHVCGAWTPLSSTAGASSAVCGSQSKPEHSGELTAEQREAAYQAYRAGLHSIHCDCVAALTARLAEAEAERDAARAELAKWASPTLTRAIAGIGQLALDAVDMERQRNEAQREYMAIRAVAGEQRAAIIAWLEAESRGFPRGERAKCEARLLAVDKRVCAVLAGKEPTDGR